MELRPSNEADADACVEIVRDLPDYFTPDTHDEVRAAVRHQVGWVATEGPDLTGFVLGESRYRGSAELTWMGVLPEHQGRGIGTALLQRLLAEFAAASIAVVEVKTLDASTDYEPYVATRAFYERRGFIQVDAIDPFPGWDPGNACGIYIVVLPANRVAETT